VRDAHGRAAGRERPEVQPLPHDGALRHAGCLADGPQPPVSHDYDGESSVFTGTVNWVQIDLGDDAEDADHLITPEERLRVAMARQ
jgi:hypothetical protein